MHAETNKKHRQSLRLVAYDYAQAGAYFITIVTRERACLLGKILDGDLLLNDAGKIVQSVWNELPEHFPGIQTDTFVVMPNHVHEIIHIASEMSPVRAQHAAPPPAKLNVQPGSLGAIVRSFKSAVTKLYNETHDRLIEGVWQRNYYEHVIRDENSLIRIREYIATNPARWSVDPENRAATRPESRDLWRSDVVGAQHVARHRSQTINRANFAKRST